MYIIISTQIRYENGPTRCGDELSDPNIMSSLGAVLTEGNNILLLLLSLFTIIVGLDLPKKGGC